MLNQLLLGQVREGGQWPTWTASTPVGAGARASVLHRDLTVVTLVHSSAAAFHRLGRDIGIAQRGGNEREQTERECVELHHLDGEQEAVVTSRRAGGVVGGGGVVVVVVVMAVVVVVVVMVIGMPRTQSKNRVSHGLASG